MLPAATEEKREFCSSVDADKNINNNNNNNSIYLNTIKNSAKADVVVKKSMKIP